MNNLKQKLGSKILEIITILELFAFKNLPYSKLFRLTHIDISLP